MISFSSFADEFEKIAARAGLRQIRRLVNSGLIDEANLLAKAPGVLKSRLGEMDNPIGSMVKMLSRKATKEGPVLLTASPDLGLAATKIPHRLGLSTPRSVTARTAFSKIDHPANVKTLATDYMEGLKAPITHSEYVHGFPLSEYGNNAKGLSNTQVVERVNEAKRSVFGLRDEAAKQGLRVEDLHNYNIMIDPKGQGRVVDSMVMRPGDLDPRHSAPAGLGQGVSPHRAIKDVMKEMGEFGFARQQRGPAPKDVLKRRPPPF